jgi:hypothetical protein
VPENTAPLPDFTRWPSFPFEGDMRIKRLVAPVDVEPPRSGEDAADCVACNTPDDAYIWVSERWRVRAMDRPTGLPMVLILECRSHLDLGDLPNLLAAELGVMTVRLERAIRSLDEVARVHVNRWGDGSAHLHMWFLARPYGRLQLRGTFLSLWDDILPVIPEQQWRENLALVAAWLAEFGGRANAEPAHIQWQSPSRLGESPSASTLPDFADNDSTTALDRASESQGDQRTGDQRTGDQRTGGQTAGGQTAGGQTAGSPTAGGKSTGSEESRSEESGSEESGKEEAGKEEISSEETSSQDTGSDGGESAGSSWRPADLADFEGSKADIRPVGTALANAATQDLRGSAVRANAASTKQATTTPAASGESAGVAGSDATAPEGEPEAGAEAVSVTTDAALDDHGGSDGPRSRAEPTDARSGQIVFDRYPTSPGAAH